MKSFTFKGIKSGDYESFCFDVSKEDFIRIKDREPNEHHQSYFHDGKYRIYPDDLLEHIRDDVEHEFEIIIKINNKM